MSIGIRIDGDRALVSASSAEPGPQAPPFATALVEARGAVLTWTIPARRYPDAVVHRPQEAAAWIADVYGEQVAAAVRTIDADGAASVTADLPDDAELRAEVRRLALREWVRDWWPAGSTIPPVDPVVLAAEIALATHDVDHLLDDPDATERAIADALDAPVALAALGEAFAAEAGAVSTALAILADDHGLALHALADRRAEWALAAGGIDAAGSGTVIGQGGAAVRWADVPAQTVAADAEARWTLRHTAGAATLTIEVDGVPGEDPAALQARFGPERDGIDLPLARTATGFTGATAVPASVALMPLDQRTLWVRDVRIAHRPGPPESETARADVLAYAASRRTDPTASLAERTAGVRQP